MIENIKFSLHSSSVDAITGMGGQLYFYYCLYIKFTC